MEWLITLIIGIAIGFVAGRWGSLSFFKRRRAQASFKFRRMTFGSRAKESRGPAKVYLDDFITADTTEPGLDHTVHPVPEFDVQNEPQLISMAISPHNSDNMFDDSPMLTAEVRQEAEAFFAAQQTPVETSTTQSEPQTTETSKVSEPLTGTLFIGVYAIKPRQRFSGHEIMQVVTALGLQYGEGELFHYYDKTGRVRYSVAAATKQGTFDLATLGGFTCPGLIVYMDLTTTTDPKADFDAMLATARKLAEELDGKLVDQERNPLTLNKVQEIHQQFDHALS